MATVVRCSRTNKQTNKQRRRRRRANTRATLEASARLCERRPPRLSLLADGWAGGSHYARAGEFDAATAGLAGKRMLRLGIWCWQPAGRLPGTEQLAGSYRAAPLKKLLRGYQISGCHYFRRQRFYLESGESGRIDQLGSWARVRPGSAGASSGACRMSSKTQIDGSLMCALCSRFTASTDHRKVFVSRRIHLAGRRLLAADGGIRNSWRCPCRKINRRPRGTMAARHDAPATLPPQLQGQHQQIINFIAATALEFSQSRPFLPARGGETQDKKQQ